MTQDIDKPWYYTKVPRLGNVAVSRHAQERMESWGVTQGQFERVLRQGSDIPDGFDTIWRAFGGIRAIILLNPTPYVGAKLVKTVYRIQAAASVPVPQRMK